MRWLKRTLLKKILVWPRTNLHTLGCSSASTPLSEIDAILPLQRTLGNETENSSAWTLEPG
jgi:hypothetical protein